MELSLKRFFKRWYHLNGRKFPWRQPDVTPFGILVAEILLRQTNSVMVAKVWPSFINDYPNPKSIIGSSSDDIFGMVSELGLGHQRVDALQQVALSLDNEYDGRVPNSIPRLLQLPHLGLYSAHAIACFAFHRRVPVVDGNVIRVFARLTGEDFPRDNRRGRSVEVWELAQSIIPSRKVYEHNYGILDFSAQVCKPIQPNCGVCPVRKYCQFGLYNSLRKHGETEVEIKRR